MLATAKSDAAPPPPPERATTPIHADAAASPRTVLEEWRRAAACAPELDRALAGGPARPASGSSCVNPTGNGGRTSQLPRRRTVWMELAQDERPVCLPARGAEP